MTVGHRPRREQHAALVMIAATTILGACAVEGSDGSSDRLDQTARVPVTAVPTTVTTTTTPATTSTTMTSVERRLVTRCVDYVMFKAYVGDAVSLEIWTAAGENEPGLERACSEIARNDPLTAQAMSDEMDDLDAFFAATAAATTTTTTTTTTAPPVTELPVTEPPPTEPPPTEPPPTELPPAAPTTGPAPAGSTVPDAGG